MGDVVDLAHYRCLRAAAKPEPVELPCDVELLEPQELIDFAERFTKESSD